MGQPTFGEWEGFAVTEENMHTLYVAVGFAHALGVTSDLF
jgi:dTDP-4-dehydrorhamnose 3,5-epimerase-like enzyme